MVQPPENTEAVPSEATLLTPLSREAFDIRDCQEHRILIEYRDDEGTIPLQRDQFETLIQRVEDSSPGFNLDRLPADAEPYATVLSLHPRFELDEQAGRLAETDTPTSSPLVDAQPIEDEAETAREEPEIPIYSDALPLIDPLERTNPTALDERDTRTGQSVHTLI